MKPITDYAKLKARIEGFGEVFQDIKGVGVRIPLALLNSTGFYVFLEGENYPTIKSVLNSISRQFDLEQHQIHLINIQNNRFYYYDYQFQKFWTVDSVTDFLYERLVFDAKTVDSLKLKELQNQLYSPVNESNPTDYSFSFTLVAIVFLITLIFFK